MSSAKKLVPLLDRVLVRRVKAPEKTASGIYIPEKAQEALNEGLVLAVGPGSVNNQTGQRVAMSLKEGDKVVLPSYGGQTVKVNSEELQLFRESDILGKIVD
ncbi:hypothetical protein MP228_001947 [Amoeboaphelidium protococcarum]|nr:hypothetical protein MP228_009317 [Amoeboaphelidium protococcarum]KAI3652522.1 hypothetical protein MP228_001947 [Amoeboaphelidium protococcarum]